MKTLKLILSIPLFIMGFLFVWMTVQAGFEVLPQVSSFWECMRTLIGMAALLFYGGLCNWLGDKLWGGTAMSKFTINVSAMVTVFQNDTFVVEANSAEEAENKARILFRRRMWEKFGYADWDEEDEKITHYCNDWEAQ